MEKEIEQLKNLIQSNSPDAMALLQRLTAEATTSEDKQKIDKLAAYLLSSASQDLEKIEKEVELYTIRRKMGNLAEAINLAYIAREYFGKSRSWLYQRIKGNIVNGKPAAFTPSEEAQFYKALDDIRLQLSALTANA